MPWLGLHGLLVTEPGPELGCPPRHCSVSIFLSVLRVYHLINRYLVCRREERGLGVDLRVKGGSHVECPL